MEILERIQKLIKEKCGERGETSFSKIVGIPQVTLNNYVKGRRGVSYEVIEAILSAFPEVSAEWLLRGEGDMLKENFQEVQCDEFSIIRERVRELLEHVGLSPTSLTANPLVKQKLDRQINGEGAISVDVIYILLEKIPSLSAEWLLRGKGEMIKMPSAGVVNDPSLSDIEKENIALRAENKLLRELQGLGERKGSRSAS